ncbi:type III-A CRISPR-associated RAMP protein Csm3 [Megamonas funiformis]|uniref:type III-A CRISPR-associated RAMP protein Csm3 n=1 Tax=Megamonas funiformis TaxID=437897 RepID=UPI0022E808DC|nr:type III-A CRISPR-associated RAMP protein Csm3 [Megamonas funiformis]
MMNIQGQRQLQGKLFITANLKLITGMHIGANSDFAPIGAVDSPFIRDCLTHEPIIPGSSLKGKIRTLLAKSRCKNLILNNIDDDDEVISRLFGSAGKKGSCFARLQFFDLFLTRKSVEVFKNLDTDTYIGEIKWENTIARLTGSANPRQIERVPAGAEFVFKLVYNIEDEEQIDEDMKILAQGFQLLQMDYLGGHGSRGYGRVKFNDFKVKAINKKIDADEYGYFFEGKCS